jgi:outer membrane lipase/esterase
MAMRPLINVRSIFTDHNNANTTGQCPAIALSGGRDYCLGRFTTGSVLGFVLQEARIADFTETGETGVTALSFGSQIRDSFISQLGWRVLADRGKFQPFAEMNWIHEWADRNRTITTSLTSVSAPSYTMDAVPEASDWATLSLGTFYRINSRVLLRGSVSSLFINPQMTTCGGDMGLNISF